MTSKPKEEDLGAKQGGGKGPKGQGLHSDGQPFNAGPWKSGSTGWTQREEQKGVHGKEERKKVTQARVERTGLMESQRRVPA